MTYKRRFSDLKIPEAYEALLLDAFKGDHSNFVRDDELDASWRVFTPLLHYLDEHSEIKPDEYKYGSRGPAVLDDFLRSYGFIRGLSTVESGLMVEDSNYYWPEYPSQTATKL